MMTNIHIHTPFSFSAFCSINELVETAAAEAVAVLGINDLNSTDGFNEFSTCCKKKRIYPVFNIEFVVENDITSKPPLQNKMITPFYTGILSGKALPCPAPFPGDVRNLIASIWKGSQDRIWKMIETLNNLLEQRNIPVRLDYNTIRSAFTKTSIYEQHIAFALYSMIVDYGKKNDAIAILLRSLFNDKEYTVPPEREMEIRQHIVSRLLTFGKSAYVPMPTDTALTIAQARHLILQIGGIPCYQCKLDTGADTSEIVNDPASLAKRLADRGIFAIEFIPQWATMVHLRKFMTFFHEELFCVSIGTGRYCTVNKSTIPVTKDGKRLDKDLYDIGYRGACILAAHQEHRIRKQPGFLDESGNRIVTPEKFPEFIDEGHQKIRKTVQN